MARWTIQVMCMLCPERISESDNDGDEAQRRVEARAERDGWIEHERVTKQVHWICPACVDRLRTRLHPGLEGGPPEPGDTIAWEEQRGIVDRVDGETVWAWWEKDAGTSANYPRFVPLRDARVIKRADRTTHDPNKEDDRGR